MNRRLPHARERVLDAHRQRKDRTRKERNRKRIDPTGIIRAALLLLLVGQCMRVVFASPRLRLQEVQVAGTTRLSGEDVIKLGQVPLGRNIFAVNLVKVSGALERIPTVKEATVTRDLPRSIHVDIVERKPAIQLVTDGGNFHADRDGVVFEKAGVVSPGGPVLEMQARSLPPLGRALKPEWVRAVWSCSDLGKKHGVRVRSMRIDGSGELWLNVATSPANPAAKSDLQVRIGRYTDLPEKFQDIRNSLAGWPGLVSTAAYLDVMCAGSPAYMRLPEGSEASQAKAATVEVR